MRDRNDLTINATYPVDWIAPDDAAAEAERRCAYCGKRVAKDYKAMLFWSKRSGRAALVCWPCESVSTFRQRGKA